MDEAAFTAHNRKYGYGGQVESLRESEFSRLKDSIYLDHAGTTMYSEKQLQSAMQDFMQNVYGNPHSQSSCSMKTTDRIEQVRDQVLQFFNTNSKHYHVIFTSGCTDGLKKVAEWFPWSTSSNFVYSNESHNSVVGMREYALKNGASFNMFNSSILRSVNSDYTALHTFLGDLKHNSNCNHNNNNHHHHNHNHNHNDNDNDNHSNTNGTTKQQVKTNDGMHNLFALTGQSNFSGAKYSINEIASQIKSRYTNWRILVDGASLVGTSPVDLSDNQIDFLVFSFHKMIGYPTGLGALIVSTDAALDLLHSKTYFGGGTVEVSLAQERFHVLRPPPLGLEDGTLPYLSIASVPYGLSCLSKLGMSNISGHVGSLTRYVVQKLRSYVHPTGQNVIELYGHDFVDVTDPNYEKYNGGVISFNIFQPNGSYIPYTEVDKLANLYNIQLRTGCFCNPGACHTHLNISVSDAKDNHASGHVCWDDASILNGRPTGAIRISLGYMSTFTDVKKFLEFIEENYVFLRVHEDIPPVNVSYPACVEKMFIYPIKSCAGYEVCEWKVDEMGLQYDREWALVDAKGLYVSQKKAPKLCLVRPVLDLENGVMHLSAPNVPKLSIQLHEYPQKKIFTSEEDTGDTNKEVDNEVDTGDINKAIVVSLQSSEELQLRICGDNCAGFAYGANVTSWFETVTGVPNLILVRKNPNKERASRLVSAATSESSNIRFSNESPFLLISNVSVQDLVSRIPTKLQYIDETSFRPNIVLNGDLRPYDEDNWQRISIGGHGFNCLGGCNRCKMITIDQLSGSEGSEPLRTLAYYRRAATGRIMFGIHISLAQKTDEFVLRKGDILVIDR